MRLPQAQLLPLLASCRCDGCRAARAANGEPEPPPPVDAKAARAAAAAAAKDAAADGDDPHIGDGVWLVDHIKDRRVVDGVVQYLIRWVGYPDADSTWEPEGHVSAGAIDEYEAATAAGRSYGSAAVETFEWVECSACGKWRRLVGVNAEELPDQWTCGMSADPQRNSCEAEEEAMDDGEGVAERDGEQEEVKEEEAAVAAAVEEAKEDELTPPAAAPPAAAAATPSPMGSAEWLPERQAQWRQMREAKKQARDDEAEGGAGGAPKRPALGVR